MSPMRIAQNLRRSDRIRHEPERYGFLVTDNHDVLLVDQNEPTTYQEAMLDPDSEKWLEAMKSEIQSMYDNQVWTLIDPPIGTKPIGCKWVFKKKTDMDKSKKGYLPMSHGIYLSKDMCPKTDVEVHNMQNIPYASAVGLILYAMMCSRPDVSYALSVTSKF